MIQEHKELLLKDLCARLPYGVKIALKNSEAYHHENVAKKGDVTIDKLKGFIGSYFSIYHDNPLDWDWSVSDIDIEDIKPYLFPLSSMTDEQIVEASRELGLEKYQINFLGDIESYSEIGDDIAYIDIESINRYINWCYKNHIDINNLISMGLAIDATNLNIY